MKYTLFVTQECNLRCKYCYIDKQAKRMPPAIGERIINFAFDNTPNDESVDISYFGGEPLLEFPLIQRFSEILENHPKNHPGRLQQTLVSNGTLFNDDIADFIIHHHVAFGISCDGPPEVQDRFRVYPSGKGSSKKVEGNIRRAHEALGRLMVNAVYRPKTFERLPDTVDYFSQLGIRQIYLSPDYSADWSASDCDRLHDVYKQVADRYVDFYLQGRPHFISLIDSKIAVILRGGYQSAERCRMGEGEFAFTPDGTIFPCERLVGDGRNGLDIGHIDSGPEPQRMQCHSASGGDLHSRCRSCTLKDYCMNWCGCSNYFASGYYNRTSPFLCASEQAALGTALNTFRTLERQLGNVFYDHLGGVPLNNSIRRAEPHRHRPGTDTPAS